MLIVVLPKMRLPIAWGTYLAHFAALQASESVLETSNGQYSTRYRPGQGRI